jgi:hypothetical protein
MQLKRLIDLAAYQADLFSITPSARLAFVRHYRSDFVEERTAKPNGEPEGESDGEEERVKAFLSLPI